MATTRHTAANFDPSQYRVAGYIDLKRPEFGVGMTLEWYERAVHLWEQSIARFFADDNGRFRFPGNTCAHCHKSGIRYAAVVDHTPTGERMIFGDICVDRTDLPGRDEFAAKFIRSHAENMRAHERNLKRRAEFLAGLDDDARSLLTEVTDALDRWFDHNKAVDAGEIQPDDTITNPFDEYGDFITDVARRFRQYGELSDAQVSSIVKSRKRDLEFRAKREAERAAASPVEEGRRVITGTVVSTKSYDTDFGWTLKMLVKEPSGSKVFGTVPESLLDDPTPLAGCAVRFTATVTRSDKDETFGTFKRPTKAERVEGSNA